MAYTKSNELMTRIALKYDSYANWTSNNPVLLAGEIAIATIPADNTTTNFQNLPNVVLKVGDGTAHYNDLKFVSALAADVYDWAKAAQKPTYDASEIQNLLKFVEDHSDLDTNTEYNIVPVAGATYKYELKFKNIGDTEFKSYDTPVYIDLSDVNTRLNKVEADVAALLGGEGETGGITDMINDAIGNLNAEKTQTAGADGLALHIKQENGVITEFSGSIAADTYDAHGAAAAAEAAAKKHADDKVAQEVIDRNAAIADEARLRDEAIKNLNAAGAEGTQDGAVIKFIDRVSQSQGLISAELGELHFQSAYNAETNKAATIKDVVDAVADLNGAMHFEGVVEGATFEEAIAASGKTYVAGDIVIWNTIEYVYDGAKWIQLGDETAAGAMISALNLPKVTVGAGQTLKYIEQANGAVSAEAVAIEIAQSQVTGLEDRLDAIEDSLGTDGEMPKQVEANKQAIATINGTDAGKSMRAVATEEANTAVGNLNKGDTAVEGEYVAAVSQSNGVITVSRAKLPVIPALELVEGSVAAPVEGEVTVVTDIDVDGHKITDKRANVVTKEFVNTAIGNLNAIKDASTANHVMTGLVQSGGVITSMKEVALADIAFSGNVKDLKQTADTYVVFNCGSSSVNI